MYRWRTSRSSCPGTLLKHISPCPGSGKSGARTEANSQPKKAMEEKFQESLKQAAAFQKMWMDSMSGMARVWSDYSPNNPPPDELKKMRNGVLQVVSQTWDEYMRSPEFMQAMRDNLNNSMQWQKWAKDNANKVQSAMGSATKVDMEGVLVAIQHVERRVLDCLDDMQSKLQGVQKEIEGAQAKNAKAMADYQKEILQRLAEMQNEVAKMGKASSPTVTAKEAAPPKKAPVKKRVAKKTATKPASTKTAKSK